MNATNDVTVTEPSTTIHPEINPEITKGVNLLFREGEVTEVRAFVKDKNPRFKTTISGFLDDLNLLADAIQSVNEYAGGTSTYYVLNPLRRSWQGVDNRIYAGTQALQQSIKTSGGCVETSPRLKHEIVWTKEGKKNVHKMRTTSDDEADIESRRWFFLDIDAGQGTDQNSSDEEKTDARNMAQAIMGYLKGEGFPEPAFCDSGNGFHVLVRVALPNTKETTTLCKRFTKAIAQRFHGQFGKAEVDVSVTNSGRIIKSYGTLVYKGVSTPERPVRRSKVISEGEGYPSLEQLETIASQYTGDIALYADSPEITESEQYDQVQIQEKYLLKRGVDVTGERWTDKESIHTPILCPQVTQHTEDTGIRQTRVSVSSGGKFGFKCLHKHCENLNWHGFRKLIDANQPPFAFSLSQGTVILHGKIVSGSDHTEEDTQIEINPYAPAPVQIITDEADQGIEEASEIITPDMSDAVLDGWLGEITQKRMSRFPISFAWSSIVTVAGTRIDQHIDMTPGKVIIDTAPRTNLYLGLIGGIGVGKSSAVDQAVYTLGVEHPTLITGSVGSGEGLIEMLGDANGFSRLWSPDELSRILAKANIEQSSLSYVLTSAYYKDKDANTVKGKTLYFNARVSIIGGIIENQFGTAFGNKSFGGLYDRFAFGIAPTGYQLNYYPPNITKEESDAQPVFVDNSVYDRITEWKKQNPGISPRVAEIALRVAYIAACYSGKKILTAKDMDPAFVFAEYQKSARLILQPNGGETYLAKMVSAIKNFLIRHKGKWVTEHQLKSGVNVFREAYGPRQFNDAVRDLIQDKAIKSSPGLNGKGIRYRIVEGGAL
jgi:hypothetical protein